MLFHSFSFILLFLPVVLAVTWAIPGPFPRIVFWTVASYVFYAFAGPLFVVPMLLSTVVDFTLARRLAGTSSEPARRALLVTSVAFGLGLLAFFKYFHFAVESLNGLSGALGRMAGLPMPAISTSLQVALPAGISFYTFVTMSYTIDVYRRHITPENSFWRFACFVSLFPHLIAGPILRADNLLRQLQEVGARHHWRLQTGLFLFAGGVIKKVLIADRIGLQIDPLLAEVNSLSTPVAWLAMIGFALQIYFDFSGYSDMARGLGYLLGIEFIINFDAPYRSLNPSEFWRRWHISLSSWLRDYLYIPLGGSRGTALRTARNLALTMLLGGLWHGAGWNFVLWGALHGLALIAYRQGGRAWDRLPVAAQWLGMSVFIVLTWVPFRLGTVSDIVQCYQTMFAFDLAGEMPGRLMLFVAVAFLIAVIGKSSNDIEWGRWGAVRAASLGLATAAALLYSNHSTEFLYFRF